MSRDAKGYGISREHRITARKPSARQLPKSYWPSVGCTTRALVGPVRSIEPIGS